MFTSPNVRPGKKEVINQDSLFLLVSAYFSMMTQVMREQQLVSSKQAAEIEKLALKIR